MEGEVTPDTSRPGTQIFCSDEGDDEEATGKEEVGGTELSSSMVGSYISQFNTWRAQTDDCKLESNTKPDSEDTSGHDGIDDGNEGECQENGLMSGESLGLYQRSVVKMKTLGSEMMSSYKEPLDNAVISGTELQYLSITIPLLLP